MGIFESIKSAFGGKAEADTDVVVGPSQILRDAGCDPSGLKFGFSPGTITVSGEITDEADRQKILDALASMPEISTVQDNLTVSTSTPDTPPATPEIEVAAGTSAAKDQGVSRTYTVQSGDTLWKIAQDMYGNGSKYMMIFEANTDLLKDPDQIFPGQELVIPDAGEG